MTDRTPIWIVVPLLPNVVAELGSRYQVLFSPEGAGPEALAEAQALGVEGVVTNGSIGLPAACLEHLPGLRVIACFGAGFENVPLAAARARGIALAHAPGTNTQTVADHALGLMLALARGLIAADRAVRSGQWTRARAPRPTLSGATLGIIGLGNIGTAIAKRAAAFDMDIAYHTRRPRNAVPWQHVGDPVTLARSSDFLVAACPGGAATRHLIDRRVLAALGPEGFLVNIARGSVVDTEALIEALLQGTIAGAGLDVVAGEPEVPSALLACPNLVLTPHMAGRSPVSLANQLRTLLANLEAGLRGAPLPHAIA